MYQAEYPSIAAVIPQRFDAAGVGEQVPFEFSGFDVEDVDQYLDGAEDVVALLVQVVFDEDFLAAAVPEVQGEAAEEAYVVVFDVYCGAEAAGVLCDVVGEYYTPHGGFAAAGFALQVFKNINGENTF